MNLFALVKKMYYLMLILPIAISSSFNSYPVRQPIGGNNTNFNKFDLLSDTSGWVLLGEQLFWTSDSGQSWDEMGPALPSGVTVQDIEFISIDTGWMLWTTANQDGTANLTLAHTIDRGVTWSTRNLTLFVPGEIQAHFERAEMGWIDAEVGWIAVKQASSSNFSLGTLFWTSDGGDIWKRSTLPVADFVSFIDPQIGWAVGGPGGDQLYNTLDGGVTWQDTRPELPSDSSATIYKPFYADGQGMLVTTNPGVESSLNVYSLDNTSDAWLPVDKMDLGVDAGIIGLSILGVHDFVATIPGGRQIVQMKSASWDCMVRPAAFLPQS